MLKSLVAQTGYVLVVWHWRDRIPVEFLVVERDQPHVEDDGFQDGVSARIIIVRYRGLLKSLDAVHVWGAEVTDGQ